MQRIFWSVFLLLLVVSTEAALRFCPNSWQSYGAYCFKAISGNTQYNYDRANIACQNQGGRLASFHSSDELEFLRDNLVPSGLFYIGLKRNSSGDWVYNDTSSYDYSNWENGEPANHDNCVVLNPNTFRWSGETCYLNVGGALCRKPLDDREGPQATCVNTTVEVPSSLNSTSVNFIQPVIIDESSPVTIILQSSYSGDIFPKGNTRVVYTFQDSFGNTGACTFFVIVKDEDTTPPTVKCYNFRSEVPLNSSGTAVYFKEPEAFDNSSLVITRSHNPGEFFEVGETMVTYNYSDASGNSADCTFTVTVERVDNTPPSVTCDNATDTVPLESLVRGKNVFFKEPQATDNSGQVTITSQSHQPGDFFEEGATEVIYTFSDATGNNESCSFFVTVERTDKIPPLVECKNFTEEISKEDQEKNVHFEEPVASDNSGHVIITSQSHHPGDVFPLGETTVTYNFSDESGNSVKCSFTVVVRREKDIAPELERIQQYVQANKPTFTLDNVTQTSEDLADFTSSKEELSRDEVDVIANILSDVSSFNSSSPKVTSFVLQVTDNIITAEGEGDDVISGNSSEVILQSLERQLENVRADGKNFSQTGQNIAVSVVQVEHFEAPIRYASFSMSDVETNGTNDPDGLGNTRLLNDSSKEYDEEVVSIQLDPKALLSAFPSGQQTLPLSLLVHRSDALFQNSKTANSGLEVNSYVIAASTSMPISNLPKESLVVATFLPKTKYRLGKTQCMFWNHTLHGGLGGWSGKGCYLEEDETSEFISCFCDHLTSFAILVNPYGGTDHEFVSILTLIGCIISIICLVLTIVSLSASRNIRSKPPQKIIINLSLALLGLYLFFLIGVERTDLQVGCVIFGAVIHFFLLASIAWMSVEATNMYLMFVKVLNANVRHFLWKASVFAWGFPLVVVVASAIASSHSYASGENCFPHHTSLVFYISVFAIVVLLLIYNLFIFALVVWKLTCSRKNIASASNARRDTIRRLQNAFAISVLLGITWTFGLFPIRDPTLHLLFIILFCIFNSLQGCFIFLLFASRQKEVRNTWKRWLHIYKRGEESTKSTGFSSQTDQGRFANKKERKTPISHASAEINISSSAAETKEL